MERQTERRRELEPVEHDYNQDELRYLRWQQEKDHLASVPHVIKFNQVPWMQVQQAYHKVLVRAARWEERLTRAPIYTMSCQEQILPSGGRSGKHRHFTEAMFYIMEGRGWEIHDEVRYPWEAGDVMCVPTYCVHQHFASESQDVRLFYVLPGQFTWIGLKRTEQMELHAGFRMPPGAESLKGSEGQIIGYHKADGTEIRMIAEHREIREMMAAKERAAPFDGEPRDTYEEYVTKFARESQWRRSCPHVVKAAERPWEDTRMGRLKYLIHPKIPSGILTLEAWLQELPPGGHSGKHCHVGEEVHLILEGKGYDIHDDHRWGWEKEDIVCIPINTVHQHFNADTSRPALFLAVQSRLYEFVGHGGVEHLEDAPGPRGS